MTDLKFTVSAVSTAKAGTKPVLVVLGAAKVGGAVELQGSDLLTPAQLGLIGVTGKAETVTRTLAGELSVAILGLGDEAPTTDDWRELGGAIGRRAQ